jgi:hypothetical protein
MAIGSHTAYAAVIDPRLNRVTLWQTAVGSDTWHRVTGVPRLRDFTSFAGVTDDDRVGLLVSGEGGSGNALVTVGPEGTTTVPVPFGVDVLARAGGNTFWASVPDPRGLRISRLDNGQWLDLGAFRAQNWWPLDADRVLLDQVPASLLTDHGVESTDLRAGVRILAVSRTSDGTFWVLGSKGQVFTSTDAVHWSAAP